MKEKIFIIITSILMALILPISLFILDVATVSPYTKTYYAQLSSMHQKLRETTEKKIVLIGNSAVVFGVDSALMEQELKNCGADYKVCNFGLYGTLGTQMMLDLSEEYITKEDIVIFMPEPYGQTFSLYFSPQEAWRAIDSDRMLFRDLSSESQQKMIGAYSSFVAEKRKYAGIGISGDGVYSKDSFDENGDLKNVERLQNTMKNGYDENNLIDLNGGLFETNFCNYVKEYKEKIEKRGAKMYYALAPLNQAAIREEKEIVTQFCIKAREEFSMGIMGNPLDSVMEKEWFYDSNFHLNDAGMTAYTAYLTEDIKTKLGIAQPSGIILPNRPELPDYEVSVEGDNSQSDCFLYEENEKGYTIVGLSEKGKTKTSLTLPIVYNGKAVTEFSKTVFQNNQVIENIIIQTNINRILDDSFNGCTALSKITLRHTHPTQISIGFALLNGTESCKIYVQTEHLSAFYGDYVWGFYLEYMEGYND